MVHRIDLLAIAGSVVKCFAKGITNECLEAAAGMAIVNLSRVVGRSTRGDEIRVVTEGNDSKLAVRQHRIATGSARQYGPCWQSDPTKRRARAQHECVVRTNVDITFAARPAALGRER